MIEDYISLGLHALVPMSLGVIMGYFIGLKCYAKKNNLEMSLK